MELSAVEGSQMGIMSNEELDTIDHLTAEAIYSLKTATIKGQKQLKKEIASFVYKAYVTGKTEGSKDKFFA